MFSSSQIVIFLLVTVFTASLVFGAPNECANWRDEIDTEGKTVFLAGDRSLIIPQNMSQMDNLCSKYQKSLESIKKVARLCLKPFPKQVTGLLIYGARIQMKNICNNTSEKNKLIDMAKCIATDLSAIDELHTTMDNYTKKVEIIRDTIKSGTLEQSSLVCCHYHDMKRIIRSTFVKWCPSSSIEYTINLIDSMLSDVMDLVCARETENSDKCLNLVAQTPIPIPESKIKLSKSALLPLTDIYTALGDHS